MKQFYFQLILDYCFKNGGDRSHLEWQIYSDPGRKLETKLSRHVEGEKKKVSKSDEPFNSSMHGSLNKPNHYSTFNVKYICM